MSEKKVCLNCACEDVDAQLFKTDIGSAWRLEECRNCGVETRVHSKGTRFVRRV